LSDRERVNANNWFSNTVRTRLDDQRTGVIIIIMQRLHMDDLVGHVIRNSPAVSDPGIRSDCAQAPLRAM
jgi:hypothetical protein